MTWLAPKDVARMINLSVSRVRQLDCDGSLPSTRDSSGRRLFHPDVVNAFIEKRRQESLRTVLALMTPERWERVIHENGFPELRIGWPSTGAAEPRRD